MEAYVGRLVTKWKFNKQSELIYAVIIIHPYLSRAVEKCTNDPTAPLGVLIQHFTIALNRKLYSQIIFRKFTKYISVTSLKNSICTLVLLGRECRLKACVQVHGKGVLKLQNLSVHTLWMIPKGNILFFYSCIVFLRKGSYINCFANSSSAFLIFAGF